MKWMLAFMLALVLTLGAALAEAPTDSRIVTFTDSLPDTLVPAFSGAQWSGARPVCGQVCRRFGEWCYGQLILRDTAGFILCGTLYTKDGWLVTSSRTALRQDEAPLLETKAVTRGYSDYEISQNGGCDTFDVVYPDARYSWFSSAAGWQLYRVVIGADTVSVSKRELNWNGQILFNTQPVLLSEFDLSTFPLSLEAAQNLVAQTGLADSTQAITTIAKDDIYVIHDDEPIIAMRPDPSENGEVVARYYDGVDMTVLEQQPGFTKVRIGTQEGWMRRANVLIGGERAAQFNWGGAPGSVYTAGPKRKQPVYDKPSEGGLLLAELDVYAGVRVLGIMHGGEWLHVQYHDGQTGWMRCDAVSETSNYYDAWVYSDDPARRLNLRAGPDTASASLGKYYSGVHVIRLFPEEYRKGWMHAVIEGVSGWVKTEFLLFYCDYNGSKWLPPIGRVTGTDKADLHSGADLNAEVTAQYAPDTAVEIMGVAGEWAHVRLRDGNTGYMLLKNLGGEPEAAAANNFTVSKDASLYKDQYGDDAGTLKAGTKVHITERPVKHWWFKPEDAAGKSGYTLVFEEPKRFRVTAGDESGGYISSGDLSLDGWPLP